MEKSSAGKMPFHNIFSALEHLQNSVWVSKAYVIIVMEFNRTHLKSNK